MGVMTRMGSRGEVLVAVRDQGGERVDGVGWLHNRNLIGLWKRNTNRFKKKHESIDKIILRALYGPSPPSAVQLERTTRAAYAVPQTLLFSQLSFTKERGNTCQRDT